MANAATRAVNPPMKYLDPDPPTDISTLLCEHGLHYPGRLDDSTQMYVCACGAFRVSRLAWIQQGRHVAARTTTVGPQAP